MAQKDGPVMMFAIWVNDDLFVALLMGGFVALTAGSNWLYERGKLHQREFDEMSLDRRTEEIDKLGYEVRYVKKGQPLREGEAHSLW